MNKIALFDIDKTLIPYDSFLKWIACVIKKKKSGFWRLPGLLLSGITAFSSPQKLTRYKEKWLSLADGLTEEEKSEEELRSLMAWYEQSPKFQKHFEQMWKQLLKTEAETSIGAAV
ncbi:MAG: hypothetical protein II258_03130, partial [Spirochaetales bacterium]|nr:hypothetical protein [Spirochaetales bacterium]